MADGIGDVLGVTGLTLEDRAETDDGFEDRVIGLGKAGGHDRDFEGAGDANDFNASDAGGGQFLLGGLDEGVGVGGVVLGGNNGDGRIQRFATVCNLRQHTSKIVARNPGDEAIFTEWEVRVAGWCNSKGFIVFFSAVFAAFGCRLLFWGKDVSNLDRAEIIVSRIVFLRGASCKAWKDWLNGRS